MEPAGSDIGAIEETVVFLDYFKELPDPRQAGKVIYPLAEVLLLCLLAVLAGAESFVDIARFGEKKIEFLRRFRPFHMARPRTITSAIFSPSSTPSASNAVSLTGWQR